MWNLRVNKGSAIILATLGVSFADFLWLRMRQAADEAGRANAREVGQIRQAGVFDDLAAAARPRTIVRDLSFIAPESEHACEFVVRNDTAYTWLLSEVRTVCRCTRVVASSNSIAPDSEGTFTVRYHAPPKNADDQRTLTLDFARAEGQGQAQVFLVVRARVRTAMTVVPSEVRLSADGRVQRLEVQNFSSDDWRGIEATSDAPCVSVRVDPAPVSHPGEKPRQVWRLAVSEVEGRGQGEAPEFATVSVKAASDRHEQSQFRVYLPASRRGRVKPESIFFGRVPAGSVAKRTAVLQLPAGSGTDRPPTVRHDLGPLLTVSAKPLRTDSFLLELVLNSPSDGGLVRGEMVVEHPGLDRKLIVPIFAKGADHEE
ncbi:MAG TPA: DUF1573 domain-containing protein [Pirellulales bacterium]|nr:DUF1573 domain-containing protein [Pirellulales bacterium]